jgi:tRNA A-37 threonylcarbamoyl transferase component Bud32
MTGFVLTAENARQYALERGLISDPHAQVEPLTGGVSCAVIRLHPQDAPAIVVKQALEKLKVAADWHSDPARIENEIQFIRIASTVLGADNVPHIVDEDVPNFMFTMTSAPLDAANWKEQMLAGETSLDLAQQCGHILAKIHNIKPDHPMITDTLRSQKYFCELRIDAYLYASAANEPDVHDELYELAERLMQVKTALVHADYTPKNFLVSSAKLFLLDYEVGHIGNPIFDVASILNHFYLKSRTVPETSARFLRMSHAFLESYKTRIAPTVLDDDVWVCLGALMLARVRGKSPVNYLPVELHSMVIQQAKRLLRGEIRELEKLY